MKNIRNIIIALFLMAGTWSCDESKWLEETPYSFFSPENSYTTVAQLKKATNYLYDQLRSVHFDVGANQLMAMHMADHAYGATDYPNLLFNNLHTWFLPTNYMCEEFWNRGYRSIMNANAILNRLDNSEATGDVKVAFEGEVHFFRAFWYNYLANVYGDVPVYTEEITSAKADFVRAPRNEVYDQARKDLEHAISLLLDIDQVDCGRISKQAAQHLLAEVYISLGNYPKAIEAASAVIDHPQMKLMTERFGTRADEDGDPYWDLFQYNNQNRKNSGNKESILVLQYEHLNSGSTYGHAFPRVGLPFVQQLLIYNVPGAEPLPADAKMDFVPFRGLPQNMGGRGIGVIRPTDHFLYGIWGNDGTNDYRNSPYMIVRDFRIENNSEGSRVFGEWMIADGHYDRLPFRESQLRFFYPHVMKFSRTDDAVTDDAFQKNADGSFKLSAYGYKNYFSNTLVSNTSKKDEYLFRLAGTYLLRAEAYIKDNNPDGALKDINALRVRSNATPAQLSEIDIDYLLDERLRELYFEDYRMVTLMRMGKFVERRRKYQPAEVGVNTADHHNLLPIPYNEIERNREVKWENNPGYY